MHHRSIICRMLFVSGWVVFAGTIAGPITSPAAAQAPAKSYYLIGNSLTWDTLPGKLAGDVQWHVDCGVSLPHIHARPEKPCVTTSTLWPSALRDKQYDVLSVQPHYGSTLAQDIEVISAWLKLQPRAVCVIHTGWARHPARADEFASYTQPVTMVHSPTYIRALLADLRQRYPDREFRSTLAQNLLAVVAEDIAAGRAPLKQIATLYRDDIHMTLDHGRYLMHNAMRRALGQPSSRTGFEKSDPALLGYLDSVLAWLDTSTADRALLTQILAVNGSTDRSSLAAKLSDTRLRERMTALLPEVERAAEQRRAALAFAAEINELGGKVIFAPTGPQWLYLATADHGTELFDVPTTVDMYNGNNPLKGKGGKNERVTDDWLARLSTVSTLRRIDLSNCAIQGHGLRHLASLTGLRELNLTLTPVNDDGLKHLAGLTEIRMLGLASTQCTGAGFAHLKQLQKLESVNFHFTPFNDAGIAAIAELPISDRLWFGHTHFTDAGAAPLAKLTRLKRCGLGSKESASSGAAVAALVHLPLEDLALLDNQADAVGLAHAAKIVTLRKLDVSHAPTVQDDSLPLVAQLPKLDEFKLGSAQVTDDGLQALTSAKALKRLVLSGLKRVTPAGIERLRKARPDLVVEMQ